MLKNSSCDVYLWAADKSEKWNETQVENWKEKSYFLRLG